MKNQAKTHFQGWQKQAKRNSRRLTLAFVLALAFSFFCYWLTTVLFFVYFNHNFSLSIRLNDMTVGTDSFSVASPIGLLVASAFILLALWGFWQKWRQLNETSAIDRALSLQATPLPQTLTLRQQQYDNVVEEMAIASGINKPAVFYQPDNDSINAFVTGDNKDNVAITVSQGALDYLTRDELQALVAHEFGHIHNRDIFLNNRLSAILHGFFFIRSILTISEPSTTSVSPLRSFLAAGFRYARKETDTLPDIKQLLEQLEDKRQILPKRRWLFPSRGLRLGILSMLLVAISSGMIFSGRLLQAAFSRQREWLADAHAVQYTRNSSALVGVLQKALALQSIQANTPTFAQDSAHFLFINYQNHWLSTHPALPERIQRYGHNLNTDQLQALAHRLKQDKFSEEQQEQQSSHSDSALTNVGENMPPQVIKEKFYPLLAIHQYQQGLSLQTPPSPTVAAAAVLAQFVLLSGISLEQAQQTIDWDDALTTLIKTQVNYLNQQHPTTHIHLFLHYLPTLKDYGEKRRLLADINQLISADNTYTLCEISYFLCLRHLWKPKKKQSDSNWESLSEQIIPVIKTVAAISDDNEKTQQTNYQLLADALLLPHVEPYQKPSINNRFVKSLYHHLITLSQAKATYKSSFFQAVEKNMLAAKQLSSEQNHLLNALRYLLVTDSQRGV